jgi:Mg2+/Co2+ transporter CorB
MDNMVMLIVIVLCLCLEGLYSGGEIAFISSDIHRIRYKAQKGSRSAQLA